MGNMFHGSAATTPTQYLASLKEPHKTDVKNLDALIRNATELKPVMHTGMLGYGVFDYVSPSGRAGSWPVIAASSRAQYISLYICATDGKQYIAEGYKKQLPKASIGKSCIRFKKLADVDADVLAEIVRKADAWRKAYVPGQAWPTKKKPATKGKRAAKK